MRLRLFQGGPSLSIFSSQSGFVDPGRCVHNLKAGRPAALKQIRSVFSESLIYIATELLPKGADKRQVAEIVVGAFQSLWSHRESIQDPEQVKIFLNQTVMDACKELNPALDERSTHLIVAFAEIARTLIATEQALPQRYQSFYRAKFVQKQSDVFVGDALGLTPEEVRLYTGEVSAVLKKLPKW